MQRSATKNGRRDSELPPSSTPSARLVSPSLGIRYHIGRAVPYASLSPHGPSKGTVWLLHQWSWAGSSGGKYIKMLWTPLAGPRWLDKAVPW